MHALLLMVATAAVGVDTGWRPTEDGGLEYLIQIQPELVEQFSKEGFTSEIPPELKNVRRFRITVGREVLPREFPKNPAPAGSAPGSVIAPPGSGGAGFNSTPTGADPRAPFGTTPSTDSRFPTTPPAAPGGTSAPLGQYPPGGAYPPGTTNPPDARFPSDSRFPTDARPLGATPGGSLDNRSTTDPNYPSNTRFPNGAGSPTTGGTGTQPPGSGYSPSTPVGSDPYRNNSTSLPRLGGDETAYGSPRTFAPINDDEMTQMAGTHTVGYNDPPAKTGSRSIRSDSMPSSTSSGSNNSSTLQASTLTPLNSTPAPTNQQSTAPVERPWMALMLTLMALFGSLGANVYMGWLNWGAQEKYRRLLAQMRDRTVMEV